MAEFEVEGKRYQSHKMNAMTQLRVLKRLAPVLQVLKSAQGVSLSTDKAGSTPNLRIDYDKMIDGAASAIGGMSDDDQTYIIGNCLSVTKRYLDDGTSLTNTWQGDVNGSGRPSLPDINLAVMMMICMNVLKDNYLSFFPAGLWTSSEPPA